MKRYCGVFRTVGDRRLGDHLLAGLEALLPPLLPAAPSLPHPDVTALAALAAEVTRLRGLPPPPDHHTAGGGREEAAAAAAAAAALVETEMLRFLGDGVAPADCVRCAPALLAALSAPAGAPAPVPPATTSTAP